MGYGKGVGGCHACIKYLLFAFNFLFWLMGCGLVGIGIWALVDKKFKELSQNQGLEMLSYAAIAVIVIGSIILAVGFFGCCGAIRESQCLLVTFFICLFLLFAALVGAGVWVLVSRDTFIQETRGLLSKAAKGYYNQPTPPGKGLLDFVQSVLECCGGASPHDYAPNNFPPSCPGLLSGATFKNIVDGTVGCADKLESMLKTHTVIISGITIGVGVIMLLGMVLSMLLCCAIKDTN